MKILVTGGAGFIGFYVVKALLAEGHEVLSIDNLNDYYDVNLKKDRLKNIEDFSIESGLQHNYKFQQINIADRAEMTKLFVQTSFDQVIHLAAQAGVRYSLENPYAYMDANMVGFLNILEGCRTQKVQHLIYASSSSVYGLNTKIPFSTDDRVDFPISLYAATKKSNELMAFTYSHLYHIPMTGLRFFTVYGPWGRPDMAYFSFTEKILKEEPINLFNQGKMERDFTYIDDIVEGIIRLKDQIPSINLLKGSAASAPYKIYNIGNHQPITLERFVQAIEQATGKKAKINLLPMQPGDVSRTYADVEDLISAVGFKPATSIEIGIGKFVEWYQKEYQK